MSNKCEIKLEKEGYLSSKASFDNKIENIKDTKNTFDSGIKLLYKSWIGKAKNTSVLVTDELNSSYAGLIENAEKLSISLNEIYETVENMDNAIADSYDLSGDIAGGEN